MCPDGQDIVPFLRPAAGSVSVRFDRGADYVLSLGTGMGASRGGDRLTDGAVIAAGHRSGC